MYIEKIYKTEIPVKYWVVIFKHKAARLPGALTEKVLIRADFILTLLVIDWYSYCITVNIWSWQKNGYPRRN
jgi:hypothetical protein